MAFQHLCVKLPKSVKKSFTAETELDGWQTTVGSEDFFDFHTEYFAKSNAHHLMKTQHSLDTILRQYSVARKALFKRVRSGVTTKIPRVEATFLNRRDRLLTFRPTNRHDALKLVQFLLLNLESLEAQNSHDVMRKISQTIVQSNEWAG